MPTYVKLHSVMLVAADNIKGKRFVTLDGRHAATPAAAVGISENDCPVGRAFSALTGYSGLVEAASAIPFGSPVKPVADGSGRAVVGAAGDHCGRALSEAVAAGQLLEVRFIELGGSDAPTSAYPPVIVSAPTITGTPTEGQTLTVSNGTWTNSPSGYARQWLRDGVAIASATAATYPLVAADAGTTISCTVTASNSSGSSAATAAGVGPVAGAVAALPVNSQLPAISGTAQVGQTLTVTNGTWTNTPTGYTRQWLRNGVAISGATGVTYALVAADLGAVIACSVTATNASGSASATSAATTAVGAAAADTRPRFFVAPANAYNSGTQAYLNGATVLTGSSNGNVAGTFALTTTAGNYGWIAVPASASTTGVRVFDGVGYGGWSGAGLAGNNTGASPDPSTSSTTFTDAGGATWRLFRQDYVNANPSAGSYTVSAA